MLIDLERLHGVLGNSDNSILLFAIAERLEKIGDRLDEIDNTIDSIGESQREIHEEP